MEDGQSGVNGALVMLTVSSQESGSVRILPLLKVGLTAMETLQR